VATGAFFFALTGVDLLFLALVAFVFFAALRLRPEGLLARFFEALFGFFEALFGFFEVLVRPFFFFVAIPICSLFVGKA
jgi:hypothetical protein